MIKVLSVAALVFGLAISAAAAQSSSESLLLQFATFKKEKIAARACVVEAGEMQVARNEHYDAVLHEKATDPAAPSLHDISAALLETRIEDEALEQKRRECEARLDEVVGAINELRRQCVAYPVKPDPDEAPSPLDTAAIDICRTVTGRDAYAAANRAPQ